MTLAYLPTADRPSEARNLLDLARTAAERATCSRLQVGAVIARRGHVLSTGRNGAAPGEEHCHHEDDRPCEVSLHAERNAIAFAARHGAATEGAILYVTHAPCFECAGVLLSAGIVGVVYGEPYRTNRGLGRLMNAGVTIHRLDPP